MTEHQDRAMRVTAIRNLADMLEGGTEPSEMLRSLVASSLGLERDELQRRNIEAIVEQTTASKDMAEGMASLTAAVQLLTVESKAAREQELAVNAARHQDAKDRDERLEKWARIVFGAIAGVSTSIGGAVVWAFNAGFLN